MAGNFRCLTCTGGRGSEGRLQKQRLLRLVLSAFVTLTTGADTKGLPAAAAAAAASPYVSAAASAAAAAVFAAAAASGGDARKAIVEAAVAAAHAAGNTMQAVDQQAALQAAAAASSMSSMSGVLTDMLAQSQASKDFNWLKNTQMLLELLEKKRSGQYSFPPPPLSHMESRLQQMIDSLRRDTHSSKTLRLCLVQGGSVLHSSATLAPIRSRRSIITAVELIRLRRRWHRLYKPLVLATWPHTLR